MIAYDVNDAPRHRLFPLERPNEPIQSAAAAADVLAEARCNARGAERPGATVTRRFCAPLLFGARSFLRLLIPLFSINGFIAEMIT